MWWGASYGTFPSLATRMIEQVVRAPTLLGTESRAAFYEEALQQLSVLAQAAGGSAGRLVIDLSGTNGIDSMGLSTLVLLQLRAAERRVTICLRGASEEVRFLLLMTRLEDRFDLEAKE